MYKLIYIIINIVYTIKMIQFKNKFLIAHDYNGFPCSTEFSSLSLSGNQYICWNVKIWI